MTVNITTATKLQVHTTSVFTAMREMKIVGSAKVIGMARHCTVARKVIPNWTPPTCPFFKKVKCRANLYQMKGVLTMFTHPNDTPNLPILIPKIICFVIIKFPVLKLVTELYHTKMLDLLKTISYDKSSIAGNLIQSYSINPPCNRKSHTLTGKDTEITWYTWSLKTKMMKH